MRSLARLAIPLVALPLGAAQARSDVQQPDVENEEARRSHSLSDALLDWVVEEEREVSTVGFDWERGLRLGTADGSRSLHVGARLLLDGGLLHYGHDLADRVETGWDDEADVRQARIFVRGSLL